MFSSHRVMDGIPSLVVFKLLIKPLAKICKMTTYSIIPDILDLNSEFFGKFVIDVDIWQVSISGTLTIRKKI